MKLLLSIVLFTCVLISQVSAQLLFGQRNKSTEKQVSVNYSNPKSYEIADIKVEGVEFLDNNALISLSGLKVGDKIKIPGDEVSTAIKKLWNQGIIGDVKIEVEKIEGDLIYIIIKLSERPRLTRYLFEGISKTHIGEIEDELELVKGRILTDVVKKNAELTIKKYYQAKGFLNADIRLVQEKDTLLKNSALLRIKIDKGKKVKVDDIVFLGNESYPDVQLRRKMKNTGVRPSFRLFSNLIGKAIKLLNPLNLYKFTSNRDSSYQIQSYLAEQARINLKSSKFVQSEFDEDLKSVIQFYNSKGHRDASIVYDSVYSTNNRSLMIEIGVGEGKKYYFGDIKWEGNFIHPDSLLAKILGVEKGDTYDLDLINEKLNFNPTGMDISSLYMDNGYLFFNITPIEVAINGDSIDIEMRINEGAKASINRVTISGNEKTKDHVLLREVRTLPGRDFSRSDIIRTTQELGALGYIDPEQITPDVRPNPIDETVDIEWQVVEKSADQVEMSGGWGGNFGFIGTLGLTFNNFSMKDALALKSFPPSGDGQRLSLRVQANGRRFQSYSVSFSEPWLGGKKPNSFGISLNHSIQRQLDFQNERVFGSLQVTGASVSLGKRLSWPDDFFTLSNSIGYIRYTLNNYGQSLGFSTGTANSFTFNTTIGRSSISSPTYPRSGSSLSLSVAATPPYSIWRKLDYENDPNEVLFKWLEYHKWNLDTKFYTQIIDKLVIATRAHFGFIGTYNSDVNPGPFERFTLGGDGLTGQNFILGTDVIGLRGYSNNSLNPFDGSIYGGLFFTKYVTEIRYPVSLNPSATIYAQVFTEAGNNWNDFSQYNPYDLKRSAGAGLRIFMPAFGMLGLDWAYGFDSEPGQLGASGPQFHFSMGQQIR